MGEMICDLPRCEYPDVYCEDCEHYKGLYDPRVYKIVPIDEEPEPEPKPEPWTRKRVLNEAEKCVCGQREHEYGVPEDSFEMIGKLWTVYLDYATKIDAHDVAAMMALLKIARIAKSPDHMDSWCDLAGYASCGGEIAGKDVND